MRGPTCFVDLPRPALDAMRGDEGCFALMQALWHDTGGAWAATTRRDRNELAQMVEEFELDDDGSSLVDRYAYLCATLALRYVASGPVVAQIRRAHGLHRLLLAYHFRAQGIAAPAQLASVAVGGFDAAEPLGELVCLSEPMVMRIANGLSSVDPPGLFEALPALVDSVLHAQWGPLFGCGPPEFSRALGRDPDFRREFEDLLALYCRAAAFQHLVLIG